MNQVEVLENPIKSSGDKKEYRLIRLSNGIEALLVRKVNETSSDADNEDLAAANVTVKIGSFNDPRKVEGLAHFLEHMVHMGSTKYPNESVYNDFLTANGGRRNALTSAQYTSYFFSVSEKAFPEAVNYLEQLMEAPLLLQSSMQREREAVDSEFQMQLSNDSARCHSVLTTLINERHPASQFNCGNLKTLKEGITDDDLHSELVKLHQRYVGKDMIVVLQSKRPLDELQEIVVTNFSTIKSGGDAKVVPETLKLEEIFKPEFSNKIFFIQPKTSKKVLLISWALPSMESHYKSKPFDYIKKIFSNNGEGGIASFLRESHLITSIGIYSEPNSAISNASFSLLRLYAELTEQGAENIGKILEAIFSYLLMIKETPIAEHQRFYNELMEKTENDFNFYEESLAIDNVLDYATNMITFEQEDFIRGNRVYQEFDGEVITKVIELLNQRKFNLTILDHKHESYPKREKYYNTEYDELDFPADYQKLWDERKANPNFSLEKSNPFKTTNFEIYEDEEESKKFPSKVFHAGSFEAWHKLDKKFKNPLAILKLNLLSPFVGASKENYISMKIFEKILIFHLKKKLAQATSAGFSVSTSTDKNGISLTFEGYNDKLPLLVDLTTKFLPKAVDETSVSTFNVLKDDLKNNFYEQLESVNGLNSDILVKVLLDTNFPRFELYKDIDGISYENLKNFSTEFFNRLKVQVLVQGNLRKIKTLDVTNLILCNLNCNKLGGSFEVKSRCYQMPLGETVLRVKSLLKNDDNSVIRNYYQIGRDTLRDRCLARLIVAILNPKAYDYLRSKEQLGYGVGVHFEEKGKILGMNVVVLSQESKNNYGLVGRKIDFFMDEVAKTTIEELTDEEFESFRDARVKLLSAEDLDLDTDVKRNWFEISDQEYKFERNELAVKLLKGFTKIELQEFFKTFTKPENKRVLSLQVIGSDKKSETAITPDGERNVKLNFLSEKLSDNENVVTDIDAFHAKLTLYPIYPFEM